MTLVFCFQTTELFPPGAGVYRGPLRARLQHGGRRPQVSGPRGGADQADAGRATEKVGKPDGLPAKQPYEKQQTGPKKKAEKSAL